MKIPTSRSQSQINDIQPGPWPSVLVGYKYISKVRWYDRPEDRPRDVVCFVFGIWTGQPTLIESPWMTATLGELGNLKPFLTGLLQEEPTRNFDLDEIVGRYVLLTISREERTNSKWGKKAFSKLTGAVGVDKAGDSYPNIALFASEWSDAEPTLGDGLWITGAPTTPKPIIPRPPVTQPPTHQIVPNPAGGAIPASSPLKRPMTPPAPSSGDSQQSQY